MFGIPCVILANGMSMLLITVRFSLIWTAVVFLSLVAVAIAYWRPTSRRIDLIIHVPPQACLSSKPHS